MSDQVTKRLIETYFQDPKPTMFLSGFFRSPEENFHTSETVEIDIVRSGQEISIVIQDLSTGSRLNEAAGFTNKEFTPPIFSEEGAINSYDLLKRQYGQDPFQQPNFRANLGKDMFRLMRLGENKIRRTIELQASQVLQTGIVSLIDKNGDVLFTIDYKPKASHFPTAGIAWDAAGATILADIESLAEQIVTDGFEPPDELLMGNTSFNAFVIDEEVQKVYENRRIDRGRIINMQVNGKGGIFRGTVEVGNYHFDIWTYPSRFIDPQTRLTTQYLKPNSCVVKFSGARFDATFGAIPNIGRELGVNSNLVLPEFGGRFSSVEGGVDMQTFMYTTVEGRHLLGVVETRALMIPTAIDQYGSIDTQT